MPEYLDLPLETSPEQLVEDSIEYLQAQLPGWLPAEGNLEVWLLEAFARQAAEIRELSVQVPKAIFRYFGIIAGVPPIDAISATVSSTWLFVDDAGYTVEEGTVVGLATAGDEIHSFRVLSDVAVAQGATTTAAGAVTLVAIEPGSEPNGIGAGSIAELLDTLDYVSSVTTTDNVSGGFTAESDDVYLSRLASALQLLAPRPIIPEDFATLARSVPGVSRAIAVDGYDPVQATTNNEKTITISVIDAVGADVSSSTLLDVRTLLQAEREVNFVVHVVNPARVAIDVTMAGVASPGWEASTVETNVRQQVASFLNPALWGLPQGGDVLRWLDERTVRYLDLAGAVNTAEGLDYISTLTLNGPGDTAAANDVLMAGVPVLPTAGTVAVTIT